MKTIFRTLCLLSMLSVFGFAQTSTSTFVPKTCPQRVDVTTAVSGTALTIPNDCGGMHATFSQDITGSPATMSIVIVGCIHSSTAACSALNTSVATGSTLVKPTIDSAYDYFLVTPTWTGGTSPTVTIHSAMTR